MSSAKWRLFCHGHNVLNLAQPSSLLFSKMKSWARLFIQGYDNQWIIYIWDEKKICKHFNLKPSVVYQDFHSICFYQSERHYAADHGTAQTFECLTNKTRSGFWRDVTYLHIDNRYTNGMETWHTSAWWSVRWISFNTIWHNYVCITNEYPFNLVK